MATDEEILREHHRIWEQVIQENYDKRSGELKNTTEEECTIRLYRLAEKEEYAKGYTNGKNVSYNNAEENYQKGRLAGIASVKCHLPYCGGEAYVCQMHETIAIANGNKGSFQSGRLAGISAERERWENAVRIGLTDTFPYKFEIKMAMKKAIRLARKKVGR